MKKSRILAAAMVSVALTGALTSCGGGKKEEFQAEENANVCVYGPPPSYSSDSDNSGDNTADGQEFFETSSADDGETSEAQGE